MTTPVPVADPAPAPPARRDSRATTLALVLACAVLAAIILAHLGLIDAGAWQGDEWFNLALLRQLGTLFLRSRILTWSPRPVSEALVYLYARLVDATGRPLIGGFLGLEWTLLGLAAASLVPGPRQGRGARILLALAVLAMFLLGHQVAEVFFWPMGAAAYMTALACLTWLAMLIVGGRHRTPRGRLACAAAMTLAAGSAEVGAMAAGCLALLLAAAELARASAPRILVARLLLLAIPLAAALSVLGLILHGRAAAGVALGAEPGTLHALGPSLLAATTQFARETLALDAYPTGWPGLLEGLAAKLALFAGLRWCCAAGLPQRARGPEAWMLAAALLAAAFLSVAAALWQFGIVCCQRHDTVRQCLDVLALLALAAFAAPARPSPRAALAGPACLLLAAAIALAHPGPQGARIPALLVDWRNHAAMMRARRAAWTSGHTPGPDMLFPLPPRGLVVGELDWPAGSYALAAGPGPGMTWYLQGILMFFGKQRLVVVAP